MYKINKGVPKPPKRRSNVKRKYPFEEMEVGDSFMIPHRKRNTAATHVSAVGKQLGRTFSTRMCWMRETRKGWRLCEENTEGAILGVGVWRDA